MGELLKTKVACITGGANGIGRAIVERFASEGATVIIADLEKDAGELFVRDLQTSGARAHFIAMDVTNEANWVSAITDIESRYSRLDILVNNAGIGFTGAVTETELSDWQRLMKINVDGPFLGTKHGLPLIRKSGGGSIINVSSIAGIKASANTSAYCASKGAVRLFSKSVALECAALNDGVRVNSLHPGIVETAIWDSLIGTSTDGSSNRPRTETLASFTSQAVPLGRPGLATEVANGALWLASDESSYVTGTELVIDGARSIA